MVTDDGGRGEHRWERPEQRLQNYGIIGYVLTRVVPSQGGGAAFRVGSILMGRKVENYEPGDKIQIGQDEVLTVAAVLKNNYTLHG